MPLQMNIRGVLSARTERIKCLDLHASEPWLLAALYSGDVHIWNTDSQQIVNTFEVSEQPVRCAKFVERKQWIVCGCDDLFIRVYNYNTLEKVLAFEAHTDYIRYLEVHPTLPLVLSCGDDMSIKLWDWDKKWENTMIYEGHMHYVMQLAVNPKDANVFASACLDRTIKVWDKRYGEVWGITTPEAHYTLEGHQKGVNAVTYYAGGDKPYLISGADDFTVKVWDYQSKACIQTLEAHTNNVSCVVSHPSLPLILSGAEDGTVRIWHASTFRLEETLSHGMERAWTIAVTPRSNCIAIGYDEGCKVIKVGNENAVVSMDMAGKVIWSRNGEIQSTNVKPAVSATTADGERLSLATKDLGSSEIFPQRMQHSPNGRFVAVTGDGEYIIYTALAWRNKAFGSALEVQWAHEGNDFAAREASGTVRVFRNFQDAVVFRPADVWGGAQLVSIFGGPLIGASTDVFVAFFDWTSGKLVRRIDVAASSVHWSDSGSHVALVCGSSFYVLSYNGELVDAALASGGSIPADGIDDSFQLSEEVTDSVASATWIGECFVYTTTGGRLNCFIGAETQTLFHLERPLSLLGYLAKENRLFLVSRDYEIVSYKVLLTVLQYKTAIVAHDFDAAQAFLSSIPKEQYNHLARFLEAQGFREEALALATDEEYRFDLALSLGKMDVAMTILRAGDNAQRWKQLGDIALKRGDFQLAEECMERSGDVSGLLVLYSSLGDADGLAKLEKLAANENRTNVAFAAALLRKRTDECFEILRSADRLPEAALFARSYAPSRVSEALQAWQAELSTVNKRAAEALADPEQYPNLFPGREDALQAEKALANPAPIPAAAYADHKDDLVRDVTELIAAMGFTPAEQPVAEAAPEPLATEDAPPAAYAEDVDAAPDAEIETADTPAPSAVDELDGAAEPAESDFAGIDTPAADAPGDMDAPAENEPFAMDETAGNDLDAVAAAIDPAADLAAEMEDDAWGEGGADDTLDAVDELAAAKKD